MTPFLKQNNYGVSPLLLGVSRGCNDRWRHRRHDVQRHAFLRLGKACAPGVHVLGQATIGGSDVYVNLNSCSSAVQMLSLIVLRCTVMLSLIVLRCTVMLIFNGPPLYSDPNRDPNQPSNLTPAFAFLFHAYTTPYMYSYVSQASFDCAVRDLAWSYGKQLVRVAWHR